jgi:Flp pilus assembly protein TadG
MAISVATLDWGNRTPDLFIDTMVKSAKVLDRFRLIDGVKSKVQVPIFDASLTFGNDLCVFDPQSSASIDEKEMTVETYKWAFLNCKDVLEATYRSVLLKQGQHNEETMDAQFKDWVFDYFAKLSAQKALELAATALATELSADTAVLDYDTNAALTSANILDKMEGAYQVMSANMLSAVYGDADRQLKPAFFMGTAAVQAYQIAIAGLYTTTAQGVVEGNIPAYYGMEVIHFPSLAAGSFIISAPENIVMLTDNYNDVRAIDMKYESELSSDKIWGQFKLGFSYLKGEEIVYAKNFA